MIIPQQKAIRLNGESNHDNQGNVSSSTSDSFDKDEGAASWKTCKLSAFSRPSYRP